MGVLLFCGLGGISGAYAADGTIHATGNVTSSTCTVNVAGTSALFGTIPLDSIRKSKISSGAEGVANETKRLRKEFYIAFSNCTANQEYTLSLSGANQTYYNTYKSQGTGNPELVVMMENDINEYKHDVDYGPYQVGANSRSHLMDVNLYLQDMNDLVVGDLKYDVDYTIDFL